MARLFFQPMATCDESDKVVCIDILLLAEDAVGKVAFVLLAIKERTFATLLPVVGAFTSMMADAGTRPHVVHSPYDRFA